MDLITVLQVLRRRWIVFGGGMLLTAVTALLLSRLDTATYASQGAVVIVRGPGAAGAEGLESADPALQQAARLLAELATGSDAVRNLENPGSINVAVDQSLPVLRVTAVAGESEAALQTVQAVAEGLSQQLQDLSASGEFAVPDGTEISTLVAPTSPEPEATADGDDTQFVSTATLLLARSGDAARPQAPVSGIIVPSQTELFVASVIYERLFDDAVLEQMAQNGATGEFEVTPDEDSAILRVEATSGDADEALTTGQVVIDTMQQIATDIQEADGIPEDLRFGVEPLAYPLNPFVFDSATLRTVLAVVALGTLASIGLALMVDAAAARREAHWHILGPSAERGRAPDAEPWEVWPRSPAQAAPAPDERASQSREQ